MLVQQATHSHDFKAYIFGWVSVRALELLTQVLWLLIEEILAFLFACEIHHRLVLSEFESSACACHTTIFGCINKHFKKFCSILICRSSGKWQVILHITRFQINVTYVNSFVSLISGLTYLLVVAASLNNCSCVSWQPI